MAGIALGQASIALCLAGLAGLAGCGARPTPPAVAAAAPPDPPNFTLNTPIDRIAANTGGKAVLEHDLPGLMSSRSYVLFDDMSLAQVASLSGGQLTTAKLAVVQADLSQLNELAP